MQLTHYTTKFSKRTFPIILVSDNINNALNIGSLFRTADAFGVEKLIFCGEHTTLGRKMTKSSRATEKFVPYELKTNALEVIKFYKGEGFQIISLEITQESIPIHKMKFYPTQPIILVVGDENFGISQEIIELSDNEVHIDMYGQNSSMNVVQATNIALYEITRQFL
jgi:tRNA G18 (ribose-2'-O)-methylase SpoU